MANSFFIIPPIGLILLSTKAKEPALDFGFA